MSDYSKTPRTQKKKFYWTNELERFLLKLWKERIYDLKNKRPNRPVIEDICRKFQQKGCYVEVEEVKCKMHNLTSKYRKEKQSRSSGNAPSNWLLYDDVDDILSMYEETSVEVQYSKKDNSHRRSQQHNTERRSQTNKGSYKYVTENYFENEDEDPDEDIDNDEDRKDTAVHLQEIHEDFKEEEPELGEEDNYETSSGTSTSMGNNSKNINPTEDESVNYLKAMNTNIKLMVAKVNELSDNIQMWERKGNNQIKEITKVLLQRFKRRAENNNDYLNGKRKRLSLNQSDDEEDHLEAGNDDVLQDISKFNAEIPNIDSKRKSFNLQRNKMILDDYMKTKELERQFMTEKHNLQMEILRLELEVKRHDILKDA